MTTEPSNATPATPEPPFTLAYVVDATNIGCLIREIGQPATRQARYAAKIQEHGVVIRNCHLVGFVEREGEPEIVWRAGTVGRVTALSEGKITLDLGYRTLTIPYRDDRPADEQATPPTIGERVLLRGRPIEQAAVVDVFQGDELAHPDRLRGHVGGALIKRAE